MDVPAPNILKFRAAAQAEPMDMQAAIDTLRAGDAPAIADFVGSLSTEQLTSMGTWARYAIITKLGPKPVDASPATIYARNLAATLVLLTQPLPQGYEQFESDWVQETLATRAGTSLRRAFDRPSTFGFAMTPARFLDIAKDVAHAQIDTFNRIIGYGWAQPPLAITPFTLSRADYDVLFADDESRIYPSAACFHEAPDEDAIKRYAGLTSHSARMLAFNIHKDAGADTHGRAAYLTSHETVHLVAAQAMDLHDAAAIEPRQNPFVELMPALSHESEIYGFVLRNFGPTVYRCLMTERIAYSFSNRLDALVQGKKPRRELYVLAQDISAETPAWHQTMMSHLNAMGLFDEKAARPAASQDMRMPQHVRLKMAAARAQTPRLHGIR